MVRHIHIHAKTGKPDRDCLDCYRCLDTFDMCLICHILYWYLISNYGNLASLSDPVW